MLLVVVDTNVVVSGVLAGARTSPNRDIVDAMIAGTLRYVLSEDLLAEYRRVLLRPAIAARHGLPEAEVDAVLENLVLNAGFREPAAHPDEASRTGGIAAEAPPPAVPGDGHVVALMAAAPGAILVTGDRRLAQAVATWRAVLTPAELAAALA